MWETSTIIDPDLCSAVVQDHVVHGMALLPTSVQLELVVSAARGQGVGGDLTLNDIELAEPFFLRPGDPRPITVSTSGVPNALPAHVTVRSGDGIRHLTLELTPGAPSDGDDTAVAEARRPELPGDGDLVYPPMFHGPTFHVVGSFGRVGDGLEALGRDLPAWDVPERGAGRTAQLIELLFQSCGVLELMNSGQMMRPARIDRLALVGDVAAAGRGVRARVWPGPGVGFDGAVVDGTDRTLIRMQGYRPVALGGPADLAVVARLAAHVGPRPSPIDPLDPLDRSTPAPAQGAAR